MLKSLKIENFRCFKSFEMQNLGRINLLVGANNSGKTSVLEAVYLLISRNSDSLIYIILNRGEYYYTSETPNNPSERDREFEICHLFYNHEIDIGSEFLIVADRNNIHQNLRVSLERKKTENNTKIPYFFNQLSENYLLMEWLTEPAISKHILQVNLSFNKGINSTFQTSSSSAIYGGEHSNLILSTKTQFLTSSFLTSNSMIDLFNEVVLTSKEDKVIEALKIIEPTIERIAPISERYRSTESRTGFLVRLAGSDQRIPIGSMGDGIWRILGITLALVNAENGVLLIDEIDTGLHYSTMSDMWRLVWETAKKLNVQVFATTHSRDCWESLADISNRENPHEDGITIHRIERDKPSSITFNERQVVIAAERGIEVR